MGPAPRYLGAGDMNGRVGGVGGGADVSLVAWGGGDGGGGGR